MSKVLILYATHELNDNLLFFIKKGYIDDSKYFFLFVVNNPRLDIVIEKRNNVRVVTRENVGIDFGGWSHGLFLNDEKNEYFYKGFDYFVFINSTVRGPFLPLYDVKRNWPDIFIEMLNDDVKLVGTTVNLTAIKPEYTPHVQSMLMVTDRIGLDIGIKKGIFTVNNSMSKLEIILQKEVGFSTEILNRGYNIGCLLYAYKGRDFRIKIEGKIRSFNHCTKNTYFGININPYEVIFFKTNTAIDNMLLQKYTDWHLSTSNKVIKKILLDNEDVTELLGEFMNKNRLLDPNINLFFVLKNNLIGSRKKLSFYLNNLDNPDVVLNMVNGKVTSSFLLF